MSGSFSVTAKRDGSRAVFGEHDDRDRYSSYDNEGGGRGGGRRGGGSGGGRGGGGGYGRRNRRGGSFKRGRGPNPRSRLEDDDDVDMGDQSSSKQRYNPYSIKRQPLHHRKGGMSKLAMDRETLSAHSRLSGGNGGGNQRGGRSSRGRNNNWGPQNLYYVGRSSCNWWRVTIPFAHKMERKALFEMINQNLNVPFIPKGFVSKQNSVEFHIQEYDAAKALSALSKRLTFPNGHKMMITVKPENTPPLVELDEATVDKLKVAMSDRYDPATRALDLSNLYHDKSLNADKIHLSLNKSTVMSKVLDIIQENIPELESLNFTKNQIMHLSFMSNIATKAPNIKRLNLSQNKLKTINELKKIEALKLEELILEKNTLCDDFRNETSYVSAVRQRFPKVIKLDGHDLPPPVSFDIEQNTTLPLSVGSYFKREDARLVVCAFLEEYIKVYDSNNRQSLLEAYHDEAIFSMSASTSPLTHGYGGRIGEYLPQSRNLIRLADGGRRSKLLKSGRINVVSALNELPKTEHDPNSFLVDINIAEATLMSFTLRGVFRETEGTKGEIRSFMRTFVTVPQGTGIVIQNEQYYITNASQKQVKEAFRTPAPTPSSSPVIAAGSSGEPTQAQKMEMVQQFSKESNMNLAFSEQCLAENNWDYQASGKRFLELHEQNLIPPEAFIK